MQTQQKEVREVYTSRTPLQEEYLVPESGQVQNVCQRSSEEMWYCKFLLWSGHVDTSCLVYPGTSGLPKESICSV